MKSRDDKPRAWNSTLPRSDKRLERGQPMNRGGRIKPKKRSRCEFERVYGGEAKVEWMKQQPCFVVALELTSRPCFGEIQCAHTVTGGMGRKAHADTLAPACVSHHADYDQHRAPFDDPCVRDRVKAFADRVARDWLGYSQQEMK